MSRQQAIQLASFFRIPAQTRNAGFQTALLRRLSDPDERVSAAARSVIARELDLAGAESDPKRIELIASAMEGSTAELEAILQAIGRHERMATRPEIMTAIRRLMNREEAAPALLPLLRWPSIRDAEILSIILHAWPRLAQPQRLEAIEALLARPALVDVIDPREQVMQVLRYGVTDPSVAVRERTLRGVQSIPALRESTGSTSILFAALADDAPALRLLGLNFTSSKPSLWERANAREYLKRLLIDPDRRVRNEALRIVARPSLMRSDPTMARRVKALEADPVLAADARLVLAAYDIDPASITADVRLVRPRLLSLSTFRRSVNPLFYQAGEDGHSCVNCHANHTILRIARPDALAPGEDPLLVNYNSVLKVVNLGDPDSSLLLRKPRSPQGQGGAEPESPTGLTHVGGPRWESTEHPAYRAILAWIREASKTAAQESHERLSADSYSPGYEPALAGDGDLNTIWHTEFVGATPGYPHDLVVNLGSPRAIEGILYVPRQDSSNGRVRDFEIRVSQDGKTWGEPLARGRWENDTAFKYVALPTPLARYVQLRGLSEVEGRPIMSAAELAVSVKSDP